MRKSIIRYGMLLLAVALSSCKDTIIEGELSPVIAISKIRALYKGDDLTLSRQNLFGASEIRGIVNSEPGGKNLPENFVVMQDYKKGVIGGIALSVSNPSAYQAGDSLVVNIDGAQLVRRDGILRISGLRDGQISNISSGHNVRITPVSAHLLDSLPHLYESMLVMVNGTLTPLPTGTETYAGDKILNDGSGNLVLHTDASAVFAADRMPVSATFVGIPFLYERENKPGARLWMRTIADMSNPSGPMYPGFPEGFELAVKTNFPAANVVFGTGQWLLDRARTGDVAGRDRFNPAGLQGVRLNLDLSVPAYLQMNFDVPDGATKVTFTYGSFYLDPPSTFRLEYSTDGGTTWTATGADITDPDATHKTATYTMDIKDRVRFRVHKLGLGVTNNTTIFNGRLCIDDFAVYSQ